jgi:hypothetical protein
MTFQEAIDTFAVMGRLVDGDPYAPIVLVGGVETLLSPAKVITAASMMVRSNPEITRLLAEKAAQEEAELEQMIAEEEAARNSPLVALEIAYNTAVAEEAIQDDDNGLFDGPDALDGDGEEDSTPQGEGESKGEIEMQFHNHGNRRIFSAKDGYCKVCRPTVVMGEEIMPANEAAAVVAPMAPSFDDLLAEVGGGEAFAHSVAEIALAKRQGRRGDSVQGRLTAMLAGKIVEQPTWALSELVPAYAEYLRSYGIGLNAEELVDPDGQPHLSLRHDYSRFVPQVNGSQMAIPELVPAMTNLTGAELRSHLWRANAQEKREARNVVAEAKRQAQTVTMHWEGNGKSGSKAIGPNTPETRKEAAVLQAAGRKAGFKVTFTT